MGAVGFKVRTEGGRNGGGGFKDQGKDGVGAGW